MGNRYITPEYWMAIVQQIAEASTCRVKIGCLLIQNNRMRGVGYLGSVSGAVHCNDVGCLFVDAPHMGSDEGKSSCIRTIHAETNAVIDFLKGRHNNSDQLIAYSTYSPCLTCFKLMMQIGIRTYYYHKNYRDEWRDKLIEDSFKDTVTFFRV